MSCEQLLAADDPIPRQDRRDSSHIHLTPVPTAAREARQFVRTSATVLGDDRLDDLLVLTSELVTNAVLHARTAFEVGVTVTDAAVLICVGDGASDEPRHRTPAAGRENGRGIMLVRALADDWGVLPAVAKSGKTVWFLFRRSGAEEAGTRG